MMIGLMAKLVVAMLALNLLVGDFPAVSGFTDYPGKEKATKKSSAEGWIREVHHGRKLGVGQPRILRTYVQPSPPSPVTSKRTSMGGNYAPPPLVY